jgi:hypothetical protein
MNVIPLKLSIEREKESAIEILEEILTQAKLGQVQSVAIGVIRPDGTMGTGWSEGAASALLGAISLLNYRLLQSVEEDDD